MSETKEIRIYEVPEELYDKIAALSKKMANAGVSKTSQMLLNEAVEAREIKEKRNVSKNN